MRRVYDQFLLSRVLLCGMLLLPISLSAQEPLAATSEHKWLKQFVGEWEMQSEGTMGPDQPPVKATGTLSSQMLGDLWVVNKIKMEVMGTSVGGLQTIGFDRQKMKYIGTWVDSSNDFMWVYSGEVDESGKRLVLEADGPNFAKPGELTKYRDSYEFQSPDRMLMTSSMLGEDGEWVEFMSGEAKRKK